jgi:hypothetical protein
MIPKVVEAMIRCQITNMVRKVKVPEAETLPEEAEVKVKIAIDKPGTLSSRVNVKHSVGMSMNLEHPIHLRTYLLLQHERLESMLHENTQMPGTLGMDYQL